MSRALNSLSFRTEQADFFFPFTPVKGSARAERNLSSSFVAASLPHHLVHSPLVTRPFSLCHPEQSEGSAFRSLPALRSGHFWNAAA
jgi:hypothetical protein